MCTCSVDPSKSSVCAPKKSLKAWMRFPEDFAVLAASYSLREETRHGALVPERAQCDTSLLSGSIPRWAISANSFE